MTILRSSRTRCVSRLCTLVLAAIAAGQEPPVVIQVDVDNWVNYGNDVNDLFKLAQIPSAVAWSPSLNYSTWVSFLDIVAVNGSPARGLVASRNQIFKLTPNPPPGSAIGDVVRGGYQQMSFEFLTPDGTPIGSIYVVGLNGGAPAPGSPPGVVSGNFTVVGGTGAFVGARGMLSPVPGQTPRVASQTEDPAMRRIHGGGKGRFIFQIWPMFRPEVVTNATGPALFHSDYSPVSAQSPAHAGETLILHAKGLGPVNPSVNPGDPFPADPFAFVSSPVEISVAGKSVPAVNQIGLPGTTDTYRIDFQAPDGIAGGMVPLQVSAAWVKGPAIPILVR